MQGFVPAAGRGSRLRPLTDDRPKGLLEVGEKPLLGHVFDALDPHVDSLVVVVGYLGGQIRERFGSSYRGLPITYVEQPDREGLADAVGRAGAELEGPFLQLNGDNVVDGSLAPVVETHRRRDAAATLLVQEVSRERAKRGGVVRTDPFRVVEKPDDPPSRIATTGCFALSERIFGAIRAIDRGERGEYELADAIGRLASEGGTVETVRFEGRRVNVNTAADLRRAEGLLDG